MAERLDIDTTALLCESAGMSLKEIGREWVALLRGRESTFSATVIRRKRYADKRRYIPRWGATRTRIFERDGWKCTYCGSGDALECDHVVAVAKGGSNSDSNLTTACRSCNRSKRDRHVEEWLS